MEARDVQGQETGVLQRPGEGLRPVSMSVGGPGELRDEDQPVVGPLQHGVQYGDVRSGLESLTLQARRARQRVHDLCLESLAKTGLVFCCGLVDDRCDRDGMNRRQALHP